MDDDIINELERDLRYSRSIGTLHAVVRLSVAELVIAEIRKLRRQIVGHVDRIAAQSEVITRLIQKGGQSGGSIRSSEVVSAENLT